MDMGFGVGGVPEEFISGEIGSSQPLHGVVVIGSSLLGYRPRRGRMELIWVWRVR